MLIEQKSLLGRVEEIGRQIDHDYKDKDPIMVGVLKGSFVFLADLLRVIEIPVEVDFLSIQSYNGKESGGVVRLASDLSLNIENRDVILVEDIIDTGRTISYIIENLKTRKPNSLAICALLNKKDARIIDVPLTYIGFDIPNVFVVGYGLDYANKYRNLNYIGVLSGK